MSIWLDLWRSTSHNILLTPFDLSLSLQVKFISIFSCQGGFSELSAAHYITSYRHFSGVTTNHSWCAASSGQRLTEELIFRPSQQCSSSGCQGCSHTPCHLATTIDDVKKHEKDWCPEFNSFDQGIIYRFLKLKLYCMWNVAKVNF